MLRKALSIALLLSAVALLAPAAAQHGTTAPPRATTAASTPSGYELAQNGPQSLVERLRAIRNSADAGRTSSRRTANSSPLETSDPAPVTQAPTPAPASAYDEELPVTPAPDLPSVLVRRGATSESLAPITNAAEQPTAAAAPAPASELPSATAPAATADDAWGAAGGESSRRTARRWDNPATPTYRAPTRSAFSSDSPSAPAAAAAGLSLSQQMPTLRVEAVGPSAIALGKPATYRVRLLNLGSSPANRVMVTTTLPNSVQVLSAQAAQGQVNQGADAAGGNRIAWDVDQLPANTQQELTLSLQATQNQPLDLQVDWMCRPSSLTARVEVQQPQLAMNVEGPLEMKYGEAKVFKIQISNPGNGPAENVTVDLTATGANGAPNAIGTLGAGESRVLELELTAKQAGAMKIHATARGDGGLHAEANHEVRVRRAALAIEISAPGLLYAGTTANYKIHVANRGDAVAEGVIMQVDLPAGAKNGLGVDKKPITLEQPRWRIGDLSPGAEQVYSMQCDLTVGGQNQLVARIQGADDQMATDSAVTTVEAIADLKLIVNDPKGPIPVGQDAVYEIEVVNRGSKAAQDVQLVAQFSDGIEPAAATGQRAEIVPGQVVFEPIASIPAGGKVAVRITARATTAGNLRFRAELNCGTPETRLVAEESTRYYGGTATSSPSSTPVPRVGSATATEPTPARR